MKRQGKRTPMNGHHEFGLNIYRGLRSFFGSHVYLRPLFVVLSAFHHGKIERAVFFANFFKVRTVTAIATKVNVVFAAFNYPAAPQSFVAFKTSTGKMARGRKRKCDIFMLNFVPPS